MLFSPTLAIKRATPKDQVRRLIQNLGTALKQSELIEVGQTAARISGYSAASFTIEVFAYVLTSDTNEFYRKQDELYLAIDEVVTELSVELV
jgi:MscS family membrane protein